MIMSEEEMDEQLELCYALRMYEASTDVSKVENDMASIDNKSPLKEIPKSQMTLYGVSSVFFSEYFDTSEELEQWIENNNLLYGRRYKIEYLGKVADRSDVIRVTCDDHKPQLYAAVDEDGYAIYNFTRSFASKKNIWEFNYGSIKEMYSAFRDRGISFENDVYGEIEKRNEKILKLCKENNLLKLLI